MKPLILLEELGLAYMVRPVNLSTGEQFSRAFTRISPNQKIPMIVDRAPADGGEQITLFESGAILHYLAEKTGRFLPNSLSRRSEVIQWLFWQMAGLGPTLGHYLHYAVNADQAIPYAPGRFGREKERLYQVLDDRLRDRDFIAGDYSIADMAAYPWIRRMEREGSQLDFFPNLNQWHETISRRSAVERAYEHAAAINTKPTITEASRKVLLGA
jgi:GST-like protein